MDKADFTRAEFESLRKEIEQSKDRLFKTLILGVTLIPTAQFLGKEHKIGILLLGMPLLVLILALIFLAENHAIMRCGRYILERIEPNLDPPGGWETWLTTADHIEKRSVDRLLVWSFHLLFSLYYVIGVYLAASYARETYGIWPERGCLLAYVPLGLAFAIYFFLTMQVSTTTVAAPTTKDTKA